MVTEKGANTKVFGVKGNFDDCPSAVKAVFNDEGQDHNSVLQASTSSKVVFGLLDEFAEETNTSLWPE